MNRVIAALHRVDFAAAGLSDYGKPGNYFARADRALDQTIPGFRDRTNRAHGRLIEWLPENIPAGTKRRWCTATTAWTT